MRIKSLLLTFALCGAVAVAMAQEAEVADSTEMGVHPFKETKNLTWNTTGFSLLLHGDLNILLADYPSNRFSSLGFGGGLAAEYNFNPTWGIGLGYNFAKTNVRTRNAETDFKDEKMNTLSMKPGDLVHDGMMHNVQAYITFDMFNAWYPNNASKLFSLNLFAGLGGSFYQNAVSFNDWEKASEDGTMRPSEKYIKDGDNAHAHGKLASTFYIPLGVSFEFNVSRAIALGARFQYNAFVTDYIDNRYADKANKQNDGLVDMGIVLRYKIGSKGQNNVKNVASQQVLEEKFYESHPDKDPSLFHNVDTVYVFHVDTIVEIHRDTVYLSTTQVSQTLVQDNEIPEVDAEGRDLDLLPGWESKAQTEVVEGQSLSRLARRHYNNTFCWVYIWLANRIVTPNPNLILPKCILQIPKLDDTQKSITKEEAKAMAARYRGE